MHDDSRRFAPRLRAAGLALALFFGGGILAQAQAQELPPGPNRDLVYGTCRTCHDLQYLVESAGITRDDWDELLISMRQYGLRIPPERRAKILDYLGTYLGPNPPPKGTGETERASVKPPSGSQLFSEQCSGCHQPNGQGVPETIPPLAGNSDLMRDRLLTAYIMLNGLRGKITVKGADYDAEMPSFRHLTDTEIAAISQFVRQAWGNDKLRPADFKALDATAVSSVRAKELSPEQVHQYRADHR